jgi:hypothetical protein
LASQVALVRARVRPEWDADVRWRKMVRCWSVQGEEVRAPPRAPVPAALPGRDSKPVSTNCSEIWPVCRGQRESPWQGRVLWRARQAAFLASAGPVVAASLPTTEAVRSRKPELPPRPSPMGQGWTQPLREPAPLLPGRKTRPPCSNYLVFWADSCHLITVANANPHAGGGKRPSITASAAAGKSLFTRGLRLGSIALGWPELGDRSTFSSPSIATLSLCPLRRNGATLARRYR